MVPASRSFSANTKNSFRTSNNSRSTRIAAPNSSTYATTDLRRFRS
ncbi:hypothetical protein SS1G_08622 [Sclerotinia sclerotiorum 1980 UF-70]|uniref:Uncharacterized protein n=1 Tax=Sclerotinia sclerotiorum (strain ATCC 18683 / 1980 / Ss-1) TaxID=665079 RepID=A7ETG6_SCLS1|nr:hypothetical protein SS1G_08622 [Sclerotinia sclerotiorum 1980 UF-70]EDN92758.1 hypothetical protein SS1G_08622 [Sclerotinia sclerotiorum 1980 UF-70]